MQEWGMRKGKMTEDVKEKEACGMDHQEEDGEQGTKYKNKEEGENGG